MRRCILLSLFSIHTLLYAQDISFGKRMVDTLSSEQFWGRGYTRSGMQKAAGFISTQMLSYGLVPLGGKSFFQRFSYPVNQFPGAMQLRINNRDLVPGKDFIVAPESRGVKGEGLLDKIDSVTFINSKEKFIVEIADKLTWSVSQNLAEYSMVSINREALIEAPAQFKVNIENEFNKKFNADNICAYVKGTIRPDSFIFITAHYDHLGGMGSDVFFPGANDNASGVSLLLNLARYYAKNPQPYSVGFICFAGEEAGLVGSKYFTKNPLVDLKKIRFLINTDLAGTGEEGITVVNATEFPDEFEMLKNLNEKYALLPKISPRGKAANSDHYYFSENHVPAFFFYTMGGIKAYHDIYDRAETLPLNKHEQLFTLLTAFLRQLMQHP